MTPSDATGASAVAAVALLAAASAGSAWAQALEVSPTMISLSRPGKDTSNAYGADLAGRNPNAGSYSDSVTVSIGY